MNRRPPAHGISKTGAALFAAFALTAAFAPLAAPYDPWRRFDPYMHPQSAHLLGTNDMGNDVLSELVYGGRVSLMVGLGAGIIATALGLAVGLVSGYRGGIADEILMGMTDVFLMVPRIPAMIVAGAFLRPGGPAMALVLGLLWWTSTARVIRSKTLQVSRMPFIASQRALGFRAPRILLTDVLPHVTGVAVPKMLHTVASAMIAEASLSFLGLGDPSAKSWGAMIRYAFERGGFIRGMWWWYAAPGAAVTLCVLSLTLMGNSIAERADPLSAGPPG